jgi:glycerate kinase
MCLASRLRSFDLIPGVELVMQETGFDERLARADLVITGEGQVDAQTAFGKTALGVARRAAAAAVPCLAVGGGVTSEGAAVLARLGCVAVPVTDRPMPLGDAMSRAAELVALTAERIAGLVSIGGMVAQVAEVRAATA